KKRVKIFDKVLTKKQKEQEDFIKKEKEMQLMLRKKLKALKNGTQSVANDEELKLVKKKYNEEVRLMRKEIEDYEARVQKMNSERFEWESEKQKCEEDLKVLLKDHAQKGDLLTACQAKVEKFKERERKHHQNFDALKNLYERLEQKYKDTFNKERPEYVGMIRRVESLELENQRLRKSLSQSNNKYESLLLLDTTHQEVIEENVTLTSRIQNIEEWFDEAWAGFRLEVLNFEQKLELKNEIIRQLKGESEQTNKSTPFRKTESGVFCLQAMEELQHKFKLSKRPDWYIKAVKDLIFECSIQQNSKQNTDEVILPIEDVEKHKDDTSEPKVKSEEGVEQNMNKDYEDDFEEASHSENSSSTATSISEEVSGEQKPSTINSGCESCVSSASSGDSTKIVTTDDKTSPRSESFVEQTEADTSLSVVDEAGSPRDVIRSELPQYVAAQLQDDTSNGTNDIPKKFDHESKIDVKPPQKILAASENEIKQSVDDSLARLTPKKSSNLKRKISPLNGTKKSVSFDQKVDLQYFDEQNTPLTKNKEYVDILKAPNSETSKIFGSDNSKLKPAPVRKVLRKTSLNTIQSRQFHNNCQNGTTLYQS
uniref:Uncharacterized protein n=1 Tax=Clytia hemisphaerica TaxID=252671 RepID=A0A7M5UI42_9CNID